MPSSPPEKSGNANSSPSAISGNARVASDRYEPRSRRPPAAREAPRPRPAPACATAGPGLRRAARPRRAAGGTSALLFERDAEQPFGPSEQHHHHDEKRHRALEVRPRGQDEHGDRLDIADDQRADQAALEAAQAAK